MMCSKLKLVLLAVFLFFVQGAFAKESARMPFPEAIKDSLPWFAVFELSNGNNPFTRNHLNAIAKKNQRVALVYFATWCIPCRVGLKEIAAHSDELTAAGTAVVLVNVGERENDLLMKYLKGFSLEKTKTVVDPFGRLTEGFGLKKENENMSLPRTIIVDSDSKPVLMIGEEGDDFIGILKGTVK